MKAKVEGSANLIATRRAGFAFAATMLAASQPALAELPQPVRAMIDAAIATGEEGKVRTVADIARATNPADTAEIDALVAEFHTALAARRKADEEAKLAALREADLFDNWSGRGELGGFRSTGNSANAGFTAALSLDRQGIKWRHRVMGRADYQRSGSVTTREQFLGRYEPNVNVSDNFYVYALAQYERDRFQGFDARYAISGGMGYQAIKADDVQLSLKAGPAYRVTEFTDGRSESRIAGLIGVDFDWQLTDRLKLTQDTNAVAETGGSAVAIIDSRNTSIDLVTGLDAAIAKKLKARFSYAVEYDSNPAPGAVQADTLSRVTLIYDF